MTRSADTGAPRRDSDDSSGAESLDDLIRELPEDLRREALTHTTWTEEREVSYERLAFLGDSVLGLALVSEVYRRYPDENAGRLSRIANQTVSGAACAEVGRRLGVPEMMREIEPDEPVDRMSADSLLASGRPLPEVTEALIGACFLEHGFERVAPAIRSAFEPELDLAADTTIDFKSALQELLAQRGAKVIYEVVTEHGPPHRRTFEVAAWVDGEIVGQGGGRTKKIAEQGAAEQAMERLSE